MLVSDGHAAGCGSAPVGATVGALDGKCESQHQQATVAILLCTLQGQQFLPPQLDSIAAQSYPHWRLWASDDGSTDRTPDLLRAFQARHGGQRISIRSGLQRGLAANFLSLVCSPDISADCYAFADQDDVWDADKLSAALAWLHAVEADVQVLYCSRTRLIDKNGHQIWCSPLFTWPPGFANALVQNIGRGISMVFNDAVRSLCLMHRRHRLPLSSIRQRRGGLPAYVSCAI